MKKMAHHLTTCRPSQPSTWRSTRRRVPKGQEWRNTFTRRWGRVGKSLKKYRKRGRR